MRVCACSERAASRLATASRGCHEYSQPDVQVPGGGSGHGDLAAFNKAVTPTIG
jgi:hypothetical protein